MEAREKMAIQMRLALAINTILEENKETLTSENSRRSKNHKLITSLRKLEAASGISFPIIQRIAAGKKNAGLTTLVAIAESLDMTLSEFFAYYDDVDPKALKKKLDGQ